ncbi:type IV pilus secretin PilQ [Allohahella sp. A8]|uniref:type IV pilus secretin PilQ n=1 Tax=Allohahella sp. A8 TaxID=3141461 RepID=UPI003A802686
MMNRSTPSTRVVAARLQGRVSDIFKSPEKFMLLNAKSALLGTAALCMSGWLQAASLTGIDFGSLPGDRTEVRLSFDEAPPEPQGYAISDPARIAIDLPGVDSALTERYHQLSKGNTQSVTILEASGRTRVIVNLLDLVPYATSVVGNQVVIQLGAAAGSDLEMDAAAKTSSVASTDSGASKAKASKSAPSIKGVDFQRGEKGEGRLIVELSNKNISADMSEQGGNIRVVFRGAELPQDLRRRLDVTDFATPVNTIETFREDGNVVMLIKPQGDFDYMAYQTDNSFTVAVEPVSQAEVEDRRKEQFPFSGEKLSLNFQDIEVRSVLQLIADFTGLNLVASDTVDGRITLRLQNVPWDQALELVLKTKGLDKRKVGNVLLVAPAAEIAARERLELEANKQVQALAPVRLEMLQINYAKAGDIVALLQSDAELVSSRGFISSDARTNTISIRETADKIQQVRELISTWDVPVSQVLIEARIVRARTDAIEDLGVRWGGGAAKTRGRNGFLVGGSQTTNTELNDGLGIAPGGDLAFTPGDVTLGFPDALAVDLGVNRTNASSFAVGFRRSNISLDLELSAFELDGKGEIVAQPKIVTADRQTARIESGEEIPYQEASSSGATSISFKKAVLSLEVTPQITPDDNIIMDLQIAQDSRGVVTAGIPSIDTNEIQTQVLVGNGQTIVLGGIFSSETSETTTKTPFLGDLPYIGALFRKTEKNDQRSELLVFITPRLIRSGLVDTR